MLHITNGECVNELLEKTSLGGSILAYDDVLHEGPALLTDDNDEWRKSRAGFHAFCGWGSYEYCLKRLEEKDEQLEKISEHDETVLWFEHDLYDQLIIIQLMDRFSRMQANQISIKKIFLICPGSFPGIRDFVGLGELSPDQLEILYSSRKQVTPQMISEGAEAWKCFCSESPEYILDYLNNENFYAFEFLKSAFLRHLEQFPNYTNGLSRTEKQILKVISAGACKPVEIFLEEQKYEEKIFMGDSSFCLYLNRLCNCPNPLIEVRNKDRFYYPWELDDRQEFITQDIGITRNGLLMLTNKADNIQMNGIDKWLGGVHLLGNTDIWRWNPETSSLSKK